MEHGDYNEGHSYYSRILNSQNWVYIYLDNNNEIKHYINKLMYGEKKKHKTAYPIILAGNQLEFVSKIKIHTSTL